MFSCFWSLGNRSFGTSIPPTPSSRGGSGCPSAEAIWWCLVEIWVKNHQTKIKKSDKVRLHNNLFCFDFFRARTCPSSNLEDAVDNHLDLMFFDVFPPCQVKGRQSSKPEVWWSVLVGIVLKCILVSIGHDDPKTTTHGINQAGRRTYQLGTIEPGHRGRWQWCKKRVLPCRHSSLRKRLSALGCRCFVNVNMSMIDVNSAWVHLKNGGVTLW